MADQNNEPKRQKPDVSQTLINELSKSMDGGVSLTSLRSALYPILAVFSGLVIGGFFIAFTTEEVYAAFRESFFAGLGEMWRTIAVAYRALFVYAPVQDMLVRIDADQSIEQVHEEIMRWVV